MSYILNKTTGELLINLQDGTADGPDINLGLNVSDLDLFGKNYPLYGQWLDENFVKLLQNFANATAPAKPLQGEVWYDISDSSNQILRVYTGTSWLPITPVIVANTAPGTSQVGAQWWDWTNQQLNMYNGSGWTTVGPAYKATDGKSGSIVEDVLDTVGGTHTVLKFYTNNNVSAVVSYDQAFTLATPFSGFTVISPGITLSNENNNLLYGTAVNAQQLGNIIAANYARTDIDSTFYANVVVGSNLVITTTNSTGTGKFINTTTNGNISFHANVGGSSTTLLHINGATGEVTTHQNPVTALGVVTKQMLDSNISLATAPLAPLSSPALTGIPTAPNVVVYTANTSQVATMNSVWGAITSSHNNTQLQGNVSIWANSVYTINALTVNGATGAVTVAADPTTNLGVATKQYVDNVSSTSASTYAPINNPGLTGIPTTPTASTGTNTTQIASTAFVQTTVATATSALWLGSNKTVSSSAPTNGTGNTGDFWFQI